MAFNQEEKQGEYRERMIDAYELASSIERTKACIWRMTRHYQDNWDNAEKLKAKMWDVFHELDELRDDLKTAVDVAHYG